MKATELRIGNLLQGEPIRITRANIYSDGVTAITAWGIHEYELGHLNITPILITEEWLMKLGFEEEYKSQFTIKHTHLKSQFGYDWSKMTGWHFRYYGQYIECKYVHQLQNLFFALTGEELTKK